MALQERELPIQQETSTIHNFAFTVATKNGSGSQTSNNVLVRALFKMGISVNGKNLFPSNIKGLPTWYTIRVSQDGYQSRREITEIAIVMNEQTAAEDIANLPPGGVCILPEEWNWTQSREDCHYYAIPVRKTIRQFDIPRERREQVGNMVYVGVVAQLFGIPLALLWEALLENFGGRERPAQMNQQIIEAAFDWSAANLEKRDSYRFAPDTKTEGKLLITGNEAAALGSIFGGVNLVSWYPITPSTSLVDAVLTHKSLRDDEDGKSTVAVIQAEDEIAAVGMVVGASWAGARAMTSTSGPGISLMSEFVGLAYFAEIPIVIWDVTRMGPSTGLPTRTSQGDLIFSYYLGHGDSRQLVLLPGTMAECFEFGWRAFDIADLRQSPVLVLSDLDLGMNLWMTEPFSYPDQPIQRGKRLNKIDLEEFFAEKGEWYRFRDYDGDGVTYRTVPGTDHPRAAFFTRGTGHNEMGMYSERSDDWVQNMERLQRKFEGAREVLPQPIREDAPDGSPIGILTFGSNETAILETRDWLAQEGIATDYMRVRALPLSRDVHDFVCEHDRIYVTENNFDGQLAQILQLEMTDLSSSKLVSLALGDALPMTPDWLYRRIREEEGIA